MKLSALLTSLESEFPGWKNPEADDLEIQSITSDSREVGKGCLFIAVQGEKSDGHAFVSRALDAGAEAVLIEKPIDGTTIANSPPGKIIHVPDTRKALGLIASAFYGHPSRGMMMIGITGTSGKTTTSYLIENILKQAGHRVGLIGTVSFRIDGREIPSTHTTPGPVELQKLLREMKDLGCSAVVMEVSSHALKQHRSIGVAFDGTVFTNLSKEHLDYHPDMEDYYASKRILFVEQVERSKKWGKSPRSAIHGGDAYGRRLAQELKEEPVLVPEDVKIDARGIHGFMEGIAIESRLLARFNAENIACAIAITRKLRVTEESIRLGITTLPVVPGRLERVDDPGEGRIVLVDYAHKPDALEKVLQTLHGMKGASRIITVFGCGGDRDRTKRPVMGETACRQSDHVVITSDNPRTEDPLSIIQEIVAGAEPRKNYEIEPDRKLAIERAIRQAKRGDIVLIAGKGHETYQLVGHQKLDFDDREVAREAIKKRGAL